MAQNGGGLLPKKQQGYVAVVLLFTSVGFFVVTAAFNIDLAKPAWGMFFVSMYVIFGPAVGDLLLRIVTGVVLGAQRDNTTAKKQEDDERIEAESKQEIEARKGGGHE